MELLRSIVTTTANSLKKPVLWTSHLTGSRRASTATPAPYETFSHGAAPAGYTARQVRRVLPPIHLKNGVLRKLKHIFPNTYQRIKSICSPARWDWLL